MIIRAWETKDIPKICEIYNYYVANTVITFEETPVNVATMVERVETYTKLYP